MQPGMSSLRHRVTLVAALCVAANAFAAPPKYDERDVQGTGLVPAYATSDADPNVVEAVAHICDGTVRAYRDDLKLTVPDPVKLYVSVAKPFWSGVVTDGKSTIYAVYRRDDLDIGQQRTGQSGPLGVIARAAGQVCLPHRVPGLARFVAAEIVLPRLAAAPNAKLWPKAYDWLAQDGPAGFAARVADAAWLSQHPDHAAAVALREVYHELGAAWLGQQLAALTFDGAEAIKALHVAAVQANPKLHTAFKSWEAATNLPKDNEGGLLISSFETADDLVGANYHIGAETRLAGAWKTDGLRSLVATYPPKSPWPCFGAVDDDWRFADWSAFSSLEFDVHNPGEQPATVTLELHDDVTRMHGESRKWFTVPAKAQIHAVVPLLPLPGEARWPVGVWWDGHVRLYHVTEIAFVVYDTPATPVVLEFDNVRLKP